MKTVGALLLSVAAFASGVVAHRHVLNLFGEKRAEIDLITGTPIQSQAQFNSVKDTPATNIVFLSIKDGVLSQAGEKEVISLGKAFDATTRKANPTAARASVTQIGIIFNGEQEIARAVCLSESLLPKQPQKCHLYLTP